MSRAKRMEGKHSSTQKSKNKTDKIQSMDKQDIQSSEKRKSRRKSKKYTTRIIIRVILLIIIILALVRLIIWYVETNKDKEIADNLKEEVIQENDSGREVEGEQVEVKQIDFDKLKSINKDVIGWIKINETNIDYPIVQAKDNDYYLDRNVYKNYSSSGSIFMDYRNSDFTDKNTVIYGHNMRNNTMFSELRKIYEGKITDNTITVSQKDKERKYKIFSAHIIEPDKSIEINMKTTEYKKYLKKSLELSSVNFNTQVTEKDKIITLVTCSYKRTQRMIVQGVLVEE